MKLLHGRWLMLFWSAVLIGSPALIAQEVAVYLLGGQSNMQGVGDYRDLTADEKSPPANAFFWTGKSFTPLVPEETKTAANLRQFGPELGIAKKFAEDGEPSYLVKYFASGMPLDQGWDRGKWVSPEPQPGRTSFYPGETTEDANQGRLYTAMIKKYRTAIQHLQDQGKTPVVRGFIWMQGEQDAKHKISANRYAASLRRLRNRVQEDLQLSELPFAFGKVLPFEPAMKRFGFRDQIRTQMEAADMGSGSPEAMSKTRCVDTDGMGLLKDTVHFDARGQLELGKALAEGIQQAHKSGTTVSLWEQRVPGFPDDYNHQSPQIVDPERISEVTSATIRVFPAQDQNPNGASVIIFPGGGYRILAHKKEGDRVAAFLASRGFTCFTVRYRVSRSNEKSFQFPGPLYDARQAIRYVKSNAQRFGIDPEKVGVMGFSAGGHLASMCGTRYEDELDGERVSESEQGISLRPAFSALVYPVATMHGEGAHRGSRTAMFGPSPLEADLKAASPELRMREGCPPLFLVHHEFDPVDSLPTLALATAAKRAKVPCELHLYPLGIHGFGMSRKGDTELSNPAILWPELFVKFLKRQ